MRVSVEPDGAIRTDASGAEAVAASAQVLEAQIRSQTLLRLGLYVLAALFVIVSALLAVFAPPGREAVSTVVAFALFALAAGCAGFSTFAIKTPLGSARAGRDGSGGHDREWASGDAPETAGAPRARRPPTAA